MKKKLILIMVVSALLGAGAAFAGDWNLKKNVKRLESVAPDYKDDKDIDTKFLEVIDMTEKTKQTHEVYEESKRIAAVPALGQSKYMDSFLYYLYIRSYSLSKNSMVEPDYWLGLLKAYDKSPHMLPAMLVHLGALPKNSPEIRREAQLIVDWVKAQKPDMKVRAPEYTGNMLLGYNPRFNFAEGEFPKLYTLSYYKETVTPPAGFLETDTYVSLLSRISDGRDDILAEMAAIYRKMGKRKEASNALYRQAMLKAAVKDYAAEKTLLDEAVKLNPENAEARKERDRIKLELAYQSLAPAAPAAPAVPAAPPAQQTVAGSPTIPEHLYKVESYLTPADRVVTSAELAGWSKAELRVMRNEVFARHGRIFQSPDLQDYFSKKAWYRQNASYSDALLSDVDKENVKIIQEHEDKAK